MILYEYFNEKFYIKPGLFIIETSILGFDEDKGETLKIELY